MRSATIQELKQELLSLKPAQLVELNLRLGRFKKENKELLTYLLFEASDEQQYIRGIKSEIDELFETINLSHLYYAKKTLRKIARVIGKFSRYSGIKTTEVELRLYFLEKLQNSGIPLRRNKVISNIYDNQFKKIKKLIGSLHEDLQFDYSRELERFA